MATPRAPLMQGIHDTYVVDLRKLPPEARNWTPEERLEALLSQSAAAEARLRARLIDLGHPNAEIFRDMPHIQVDNNFVQGDIWAEIPR